MLLYRICAKRSVLIVTGMTGHYDSGAHPARFRYGPRWYAIILRGLQDISGYMPEDLTTGHFYLKLQNTETKEYLFGNPV